MLVRPLGPTLRMRSSLRAGASVTDTDFWAPASTLRAASGESVKIGVAPARLSIKVCVVGSSWLMRFLRCYSTALHPSPDNRSEYGWYHLYSMKSLSPLCLSDSHSTDATAGAPLSLIKTTRNFASLVPLAFRSMT